MANQLKLMRLLLLGLCLWTGACGPVAIREPAGSRDASATASPTTSLAASTPAPTPSGLIRGGYAVAVSNVLGNGTDTVRIIDPSGRSVASANATGRPQIRQGSGPGSAPAIFMPSVSASSTRVYYLQGGHDVGSLALDGTTKLVTQIPGSTSVEAGFAVSADDTRIAVSAIDYGVNPPSLRLYVENLAGGGNHVELFSSSSLYVWPVSWQGANLVLAVGPAAAQYAAPDPYDAISGYHLVDGTTARRLAAVCAPPATGRGLIAVNGSLCEGSSNEKFVQRWDGTRQDVPNDCTALSPVGGFVACGGSGPGQATGPVTILSLATGTKQTTPASGFGPQGWLDDMHLFYAASANDSSDIRLLDVSTGTITPLGAAIYVEARFGGG